MTSRDGLSTSRAARAISLARCSQRRASVRAVDAPDGGGGGGGDVAPQHRVHADVPLSALLGYSTALRSCTRSGMRRTHELSPESSMTCEPRALRQSATTPTPPNGQTVCPSAE